jgi:predicted acylesterase/phospholipase RssA
LRVFEKHKIPIGAVAGVSAGAMVAAAWASGADSYDIEKIARAMSFKDVARWKLSKLGLMGSERMAVFLERLLSVIASSRCEYRWRSWPAIF